MCVCVCMCEREKNTPCKERTHGVDGERETPSEVSTPIVRERVCVRKKHRKELLVQMYIYI